MRDPPAWMGSSGHAAPTQASASAEACEVQAISDSRVRAVLGKIAVGLGLAAAGTIIHLLTRFHRRHALAEAGSVRKEHEHGANCICGR